MTIACDFDWLCNCFGFAFQHSFENRSMHFSGFIASSAYARKVMEHAAGLLGKSYVTLLATS